MAGVWGPDVTASARYPRAKMLNHLPPLRKLGYPHSNTFITSGYLFYSFLNQGKLWSGWNLASRSKEPPTCLLFGVHRTKNKTKKPRETRRVSLRKEFSSSHRATSRYLLLYLLWKPRASLACTRLHPFQRTLPLQLAIDTYQLVQTIRKY